MKNRLVLLAAAAVLLLSGCAVPTPYQPRGMTGGFTETRITENTYQVQFFGNGFTSRSKVWYYWIYRCAELTKTHGYTAFTLISDKKSSDKDSDAVSGIRPGSVPGDESDYIATKGVPTYIYVPSYGGGGRITTYSASAIVTFLREPIPSGTPYFRSQPILDMLKPYIDSQGLAKVPSEDDVMSEAVVMPKGYTLSGDMPLPGRGRTLDDFKGLLPAAKE